MKIIDAVALISINETLIIQLVSFLVLLFILHRVMIRPLNRIMTEREQHLARISEVVQANETAYVNIHKEIEHQEADARAAAFKIRDDIEASGKQSAADVITKTREEISRLRSEAQSDIAAKLSAASEQIRDEATAIADKMIAALLGGKNP